MTKIYKNINSDKHFICAANIDSGKALFVSPGGKLVYRKFEQFEKEFKEGSTDGFLSHGLIKQAQKERYDKFLQNKIKKLKREKESLHPTMKKLEKNDAYHEAAHAVIDCILGLGLKKVTINPRPDEIPRKTITGWVVPAPVESFSHYAKINPYGCKIITAFAGYYAEKRKFKIKNKEEIERLKKKCKQDFELAEESTEALTEKIGLTLANKIRTVAEARTQGLINIPLIWTCIEAVAQKLLERDELTCEEVEKIISDNHEVVALKEILYTLFTYSDKRIVGNYNPKDENEKT